MYNVRLTKKTLAYLAARHCAHRKLDGVGLKIPGPSHVRELSVTRPEGVDKTR